MSLNVHKEGSPTAVFPRLQCLLLIRCGQPSYIGALTKRGEEEAALGNTANWKDLRPK
jgi:hypothetical protein